MVIDVVVEGVMWWRYRSGGCVRMIVEMEAAGGGIGSKGILVVEMDGSCSSSCGWYGSSVRDGRMVEGLMWISGGNMAATVARWNDNGGGAWWAVVVECICSGGGDNNDGGAHSSSGGGGGE
ncbi:hypothetical protein Acr_00g0016020 [Actinidia rufa]|uniref:Uncharacterized protein n=1 Tax=Actinidia rufa TaxID=165716 RepID=A0A7J0DC59_9ERIC|nr:hypothetical protein Acr_00g0016020 [Actinidia rufa]